MRLICLLLIVPALCNCVKIKENYRLPNTTRPSSYAVDLNIDPEKSIYSGTVSIILDIKESNNTIQLHAGQKYINISTVSLNNNTSICRLSSVDNQTDIATITCTENIEGDGQNLQLEFTGLLSSDDMVGLYKTSYTEDEQKKTLAATQFEPSYARRAFPCFDEPSFKAIFNISVTTPNKYTVWSNTQVKDKIEDGDNTNKTIFNPTPKMSTYLVALVVSEFQAFENNDAKRNYSFSVISRAGAGECTKLAVHYGPILIDLMSNWTGIPYASLGNSKEDLAAIPDFAAGAMENWGLITYKEDTLLDEGDKTSRFAIQRVITVIAHELAHQWFGDYVTINWWSETWLNEGFATYFESFNANNADPSMELDYQYVNLVHQAALTYDSVASALPLSSDDADINNLAEQTKKFDTISYEKGGSVIRMMRYILGEQKFKEGLHNYLNSTQYSNSKASLLFKYLDEVSPALSDTNESFSSYMNAWIYKPGFPILKASVDKDGKVTLENKKRYLLTGEDVTQWYVPLSYTTSKNSNFDQIKFEWVKPNDSYSVDLGSKDWIIFNLQSSGFYRVNYDDELWSRIIEALKTKHDQIHVLNRALLLNDIFNIAKIGEIDYNTTLNLAQYIQNETDYYPWYSFLSEVDYLLWKIKDDKTKNQLINNTLNWLSNIIKLPSKDSTENLTHVEVLQRSLILKWACKLGHSGCIDYAKAEFEKFKNNGENIDHDLRCLIFSYGLKNSTDQAKDFELLYNVYLKSNSPYEKNDVLSALACSTQKDIIEKYLQISIAEDSPIKLQDSIKVFNAVYSSGSDGLSIALDFLDQNMDGILKRYKGISTIDTVITGIASYVVREDDFKKLKKIIDDNQDVEAVVVSGKQAIEIATANRKWSNEREDGLTSALLYNGEPIPTSAASTGSTTVLLVLVSIFIFVKNISM